MGQKTAPGPFLFVRVDVEWSTGPGGDLATGRVALSNSHGDLFSSFPKQNGCSHNQNLTPWLPFDPKTILMSSSKRPSISLMSLGKPL